jgi:hypothetical protein
VELVVAFGVFVEEDDVDGEMDTPGGGLVGFAW